MEMTAENTLDYQQIPRFFGSMKKATATLALVTGASPRTTEKWMQGLTLPRGMHLIRLFAAYPDLRRDYEESLRARENIRSRLRDDEVYLRNRKKDSAGNVGSMAVRVGR